MAITELPRPWIRTPLIESAALSKAAGCRIFLKLENLQPGGSFKSRGLGNVIKRKVEEAGGKPLHFFTSSGGNAGLAAVTAAKTLGQACTVVVPMSTKAHMIAKIKAVGATDVIQTGESWSEADQYLRTELLAKNSTGVYIHPFEDDLVYEGNAGLVYETAEFLKPGTSDEPDAFVCSVGGGGLFTGVAQAVEAAYGGRPKVIAVETLGCDSLDQSLKAGERITLPKITSLATSLGAVRVGGRAFEMGQRENVSNTVISDALAAMGCWRFEDDHRMLVELACGASVCLAYNGGLKDMVPGLNPQSKVVIVVCGGVNISGDMMAEYRSNFGAEAERHATKNGEVPSTHTAPR